MSRTYNRFNAEQRQLRRPLFPTSHNKKAFRKSLLENVR